MTRMTADIRIEVTVEFDDDGERDLKDQAIEVLEDYSLVSSMLRDADYEVVGPVSPALSRTTPQGEK